MTESHKRPHRHPIYKTAYRVKNWHAYAQALRDRGDITLWISQDAMNAWRAPMTGKRGAQPVYADLAIETALVLRLLLHLPLRQTEGLLHSVLTLMGSVLPCPDHTTLSRRHAMVAVRRQVSRVSSGPIALIVDRSGLKVCGQGEWHTQKHGEKKHKRWKKLPIGVDDHSQIMASAVPDGHDQAPAHVPELLAQSEREIDRFIGDGIYDHGPVYTAVAQHAPGASVIIPPRKDAVLSPTVATSPTQRDRPIVVIESKGRLAWKRTLGYDVQSHAENALSSFKRTFGDHLRAKREESQEREASLACQLLNRMRELGCPQSYAVS
jgi:hypothetical protein